MTRPLEETAFLPAVLASQQDVEQLYRAVTQWPPVAEALDRHASPILLLNEQRQIVYANRAYVQFAGGGDVRRYLGQRMGAALDCVHEHKAPSGCGTGVACRNCHFANAIFTALRWESGEADGQLKVFREKPQDLELDVHLQSVIVGNHRLIFCRLGDACPSASHAALAGVPAELGDLAALLRAGGPFTEHFREFDEHFVTPSEPAAEVIHS